MLRRLVTLFAFGLLAAVLFVCIDGWRRSYALQFLTPAGHLQAVGSDRRGVVFFFSDIPFGREKGLTAEFWQIPAADARTLHLTVFDPANEKRHFAGFHYAAGTILLTPLAPTNAWHFKSVLIPYWLILPVLLIVPLRAGRRAIIRRQRFRRGQCVYCGYDLRESSDRCPECGAMKLPPGVQTVFVSPAPILVALRSVPMLILLNLVGFGILLKMGGSPRYDDSVNRRAGLDRSVHFFIADGMTLQQALDQLAKQTGVRFIQSSTILSRSSIRPGNGPPKTSFLGWATPVFGRFRNVPLSVVLQVLTTQAGDEFPTWNLAFGAMDDHAIFVGASDEVPLIVRTYDFHALSSLLEHRNTAPQPVPLWWHRWSDDDPGCEIEQIFRENGDDDSFSEAFFVGGRLVVVGSRSLHQKTSPFARQLAHIRDAWPRSQPTQFHSADDSDFWKVKR